MLVPLAGEPGGVVRPDESDSGGSRFSANGSITMIATRLTAIVTHAHQGGSLHQ